VSSASAAAPEPAGPARARGAEAPRRAPELNQAAAAPAALAPITPERPVPARARVGELAGPKRAAGAEPKQAQSPAGSRALRAALAPWGALFSGRRERGEAGGQRAGDAREGGGEGAPGSGAPGAPGGGVPQGRSAAPGAALAAEASALPNGHASGGAARTPHGGAGAESGARARGVLSAAAAAAPLRCEHAICRLCRRPPPHQPHVTCCRRPRKAERALVWNKCV